MIPMYEVAFTDMGFRMSFTGFQKKEVLKWLEFSHSQLYPDSFTFVRAFELISEYLKLIPTVPFFFSVFTLLEGSYKGGGRSWVSLKPNMKFFSIFTDLVRGFKDMYFLIKPKNKSSLNNILQTRSYAWANGSLFNVEVP